MFIHFQLGQYNRARVTSSDSGTYSVSPSDEYFHDDGPASQYSDYRARNGKGIMKNGKLPTPKTLIPMTSINEESNPEGIDPDQEIKRWLHDGQQTMPGLEVGGTDDENIFPVSKDEAFAETAFGDPWVLEDSQKAKTLPGGYVPCEDDVFEEDDAKPNSDTLSQEEGEDGDEEDNGMCKYSIIKLEHTPSGTVVAAKGNNSSSDQENQPEGTAEQAMHSQDNGVTIVCSKDNVAFGRVSVQPDDSRDKANGQYTINGMDLITPHALSLCVTESSKRLRPICQSGSLGSLSPCDLHLNNPFSHNTNPFFKVAEMQSQANRLLQSPASSLGPTAPSSAGSSPSHRNGALATGTVPSLSVGALATGSNPSPRLGAESTGSAPSSKLGVLVGGRNPSCSLGTLATHSVPSSSLGPLAIGPTPSFKLGALTGGSTTSLRLGALATGSTPSTKLGALPTGSTLSSNLGALTTGSALSSSLGALAGDFISSPSSPRAKTGHSSPFPSLGGTAAASGETPTAAGHPNRKPVLRNSPLPPRVEALRNGWSIKNTSTPNLDTGSVYLPHPPQRQVHNTPQTSSQDSDHVSNDGISLTGCTRPRDSAVHQDVNGSKPCNSNHNMGHLSGGVCTQKGMAKTSQESMVNPLTNGEAGISLDHNRNATLLNTGYVPNDGSFQPSQVKTSRSKPAPSSIKTANNFNNAYVPNDGSFQVRAAKPKTESGYVANDGSFGFNRLGSVKC